MDRSTRAYIFASAAALAVIVTIYIAIQRAISPPPSPKLLSQEEKAYLSEIAFSGARMSAAQNYLGGTVTYLDAKVTNQGARAVRNLDIQMEFHDLLNQVVLRDTAHPVTPRTASLKPGETRPFQVTFEHMPADWNQAPPSITPTQVKF